MNVLFISIDAVRYDEFNKDNFPNTFKLMQKMNSTTFTNCYATSCWSPLSIASLFTGKYPIENGVYGDSVEDLVYGKGKFGENLHLSESIPVYPEEMGKRFENSLCLSGCEFLTKERGFSRGFDNFKFYPNDKLDLKHKLYRATNGYDSKLYHATDYLKKWLKDNKNFFAFFNIQNPHHVYNPPYILKPIMQFTLPGNTTEDAFKYMAGKLKLDKPELYDLKELYKGELKYVDHRLGGLFEFMKKRGILDDTIIVITSDHGESFGEHGLLLHQFGLFEHLIHTPLVFIGKHDELVGKNDNLISHIDILPMLLAMIDEGKLVVQDREFVISEYGKPRGVINIMKRVVPDADLQRFESPIRSIKTKNSQYIQYANGREFGDIKLRKKLEEWAINAEIPKLPWENNHQKSNESSTVQPI